MISSPVVPAVIPQSFSDFEAQLDRLGPVPELHLDVVDGIFVPYTSWPYSDDGFVSSVTTLLNQFTLEVDLMVADPVKAANEWISSGADRLVFHSETISFEAFKHFAETTSVTVGICASNDTSLVVLEPYLACADFVQVMGIAHIGVQGQPFDSRVMERIAFIKEKYPKLAISIDGSVNASTFKELIALKLDRYIMGSAVMAAENPHTAYQEFSEQARSSQQV